MEKNNYIIKKANISNLNEIISIQESLGLSMISKCNLENDLSSSNNNYYLVYDNISPIGFIGFSCIIDTIDLLYIAVLKEQQNRGIATQLLKLLDDFAKEKKANQILLEVRKSNLKAISFYEKNNFKLLNIRKNYYTNPSEDALIYIKDIT